MKSDPIYVVVLNVIKMNGFSIRFVFAFIRYEYAPLLSCNINNSIMFLFLLGCIVGNGVAVLIYF